MELPINKIICGDALSVLKTFPNEFINCVATSPPYFALRDYGIEGQLGLEPTFQEYINKLCDIFDEIKRVLKKDGTVWVNMGDTYNPSHEVGTFDKNTNWKSSGNERNPRQKEHGRGGDKSIQVKSLLQIPSRFAIEMSNRGWILRNEIIWHKPNCMPSSAKDRFTVDFEKIFFFVKNKKYWFETQYEPVKQNSIDRLSRAVSNKNKWLNGANGQTPHNLSQPRPNRNTKYKRYEKSNAPHEFGGSDHLVSPFNPETGRNKRCVWTVTTKGFSEAHFATYPEDLIIPMIKAGCPEGGIVLDPFMGAGTTGLVARKLDRNYIGIELNHEYIQIADRRISPVKQNLWS